jgi:hypothetical protein
MPSVVATGSPRKAIRWKYRDRIAGRYDKYVLLDTNIVLDVGAHEMVCRGHVGRKHEDLVWCLSELRRAGATLFITPDVCEETYHVFYTRCMDQQFGRPRTIKDKVLRDQYPTEYAKVRTNAASLTKNAIADSRKHGAKILVPGLSQEQLKAGDDIFQAFMAMLSRYSSLGGRDAMNIVMATLLDCHSYVTRDCDFDLVDEIEIFCQ